MLTRIKTKSELKSMQISGRMLATVLNLLEQNLQVGMSTKDLADLAKAELKKLGGKPAFLGFHGYPDVLCVSVNEEVVHGIPRQTRLIRDGDIVSLDFGVEYQGMITDAAISCIAGRAAVVDQNLCDITKASLDAGIAVLRGGVHVGDIGSAVGKVLAENNYGIVRDLVGHGVGHNLHEDPNIPNYGRKGTGIQLKSGMTIAIEPMATLGSYEVLIMPDGWTIVTADKSRSAHFEHTVLITDDGAEILTVT